MTMRPECQNDNECSDPGSEFCACARMSETLERNRVIAENRAKVVHLFDGADPRFGALLGAIIDVINERGVGLPTVSVLGVLRIAEHSVIQGRML